MPETPDFVPMDDDELDEVYEPREVLGAAPDIPSTPSLPEAGEAPEAVGPTYAEVEEQPEELAVTNIFELIPIAIEQRRHLELQYTGVHSGETKDYVIEPYEIGSHHMIPGFLWGWDINAGTIKSFYLSQISNIQLLDTVFVPRF